MDAYNMCDVLSTSVQGEHPGTSVSQRLGERLSVDRRISFSIGYCMFDRDQNGT